MYRLMVIALVLGSLLFSTTASANSNLLQQVANQYDQPVRNGTKTSWTLGNQVCKSVTTINDRPAMLFDKGELWEVSPGHVTNASIVWQLVNGQANIPVAGDLNQTGPDVVTYADLYKFLYIGVNAQYKPDPIFWDWYATRYGNGNSTIYLEPLPITPAIWISAVVAGKPTQVLIQAFDGAVFTYTPSNPPGWQIEFGNAGQHYCLWKEGK